MSLKIKARIKASAQGAGPLTQTLPLPDPDGDTKSEDSAEADPNELVLAPLSHALDIKTPCTHIIAGVTNTGKTSLLACIMCRLLDEQVFDRVIVLVGYPDKFDDYKWCPKKWIFTEPTIDHVQEIIRQQANELKGCRTAIILDDCLGILNFKQKVKGKGATSQVAVFPVLAAGARKYDISLFICIQALAYLSRELRAGADVIWSTQVQPSDREVIWKHQQEYESLAEFERFMKRRGRWDFLRTNTRYGARQNLVFRCPLAPNFYFNA